MDLWIRDWGLVLSGFSGAGLKFNVGSRAPCLQLSRVRKKSGTLNPRVVQAVSFPCEFQESYKNPKGSLNRFGAYGM